MNTLKIGLFVISMFFTNLAAAEFLAHCTIEHNEQDLPLLESCEQRNGLTSYIEYAYDHKSQLIFKDDNGTSKNTYAYNDFGHMVFRTNVYRGSVLTYSHEYDDQGRETYFENSTGANKTTEYGKLYKKEISVAVTREGGEQVRSAITNYNKRGEETSYITSGGFVRLTHYLQRYKSGQPKKVKIKAGENLSIMRNFREDGQLTHEISFNKKSKHRVEKVLEYFSSGLLKTETYIYNGETPFVANSYTYDKMGRIKTRVQEGHTLTDYLYQD